ncbi:MAG: ribosome-binding factor [Candidatus Parcubacteria bacterium]|jgi:ribosome-binding factor A|nr:ribosome-binding factor [Candidatus Parcubacteria bacterium]
MSIKDQREEHILAELAAKYIAREAGRNTLITPTRTELSKNRRNVTIFVSVYPSEETEHALAFLKRHKDLFREDLKKTARLAVLPYITFELDYGELNRQRLEELGQEIGPIAPES